MQMRSLRRVVGRRWLQVAVFSAVFIIALVLWTDGLSGMTATQPSAAGGIGAAPRGPSSPSSGRPSPSGPPSTLPEVPPPTHLVTLEARGDGRIGRVSYLVRDHGPTRTYSQVASPFRRLFTTTRSQDVALLSVQVGPASQWASCTVIVDGRVVVTYTAHGSFAVVTCAV